MHRRAQASLVALLLLAAAAAQAAPVLLVSVDGMLPEYYLEPDRFGLAVPNVRMLVREGAAAVGATSVMPSVTFPAHTTMITGVSPRRHGIRTNDVLDPDGGLGGGWYWYYGDLKAPTLFDRARAAKLKTAAVTWPVTAGGPIDLNLPDMYPVPNLREAKNLLGFVQSGATAAVLEGVLPPPEELVRMKDDVRARVAARFLREKPDFLAVHFLELDDAQHRHGPRAAEALATLERIDGHIGTLLEALRAEGRLDETTVLLVSDHGFREITSEVRPNVLLRALGLLQVEGGARISSWRAVTQAAGGSAALYLHREATEADRRKLDDAVKLLLGNPAWGVARAWRGAALEATGGFAGAHVVLETRPGFSFSASAGAAEVVAALPRTAGTHGWHPERAELRAAFALRGPRVRRAKRLGLVRLVDVAPTIAHVLGIDLGKVEGRVVAEAFR